jgi:hypothetical protein
MLRILRVRPGVPKLLRVVSSQSIYLQTHWTTHSVICPVDNCPLCAYRSARLRGWSIVAVPEDRVYRLIEVAGRSLESWWDEAELSIRSSEHPTLVASMKNSRSGIDFTAVEVMPCPELDPTHRNHCMTRIGFLGACIARIYHLPVPAIDADDADLRDMWLEPVRAQAQHEANCISQC